MANSPGLVHFVRNVDLVLAVYAHSDVLVIGRVQTVKIGAQEH
ncbi:MAG TPA: hypothetical protein VMU68_11760 [Acidimicrobiales bacterium]|nr:hypothetical protein [Acidimicrobiales bacterium]